MSNCKNVMLKNSILKSVILRIPKCRIIKLFANFKADHFSYHFSHLSRIILLNGRIITNHSIIHLKWGLNLLNLSFLIFLGKNWLFSIKHKSFLMFRSSLFFIFSKPGICFKYVFKLKYVFIAF